MFVLTRSSKNPILMPSRISAWESIGAFNPSAVRQEGQTHLFYRAGARPDVLLTPYAGLTTIGYGIFKDGEVHERRQIIVPSETWDKFGCEDPRATYFEGKWYVFYTALGGFPFGPNNIKAAVAIGKSPSELDEKHLVTPFNAKAATLFPKRINGEAVLLLTCHTDYTDEHPRPTIAIARAKKVEDFWNHTFWEKWHENLSDHAIPDVRRNDSEHMEVGAAPIEVEGGWLLVYSHIQNYYDEARRLFGVEALLLKEDDPSQIIGRTPGTFMIPEEPYEKFGQVSNIVFPSGACIEEDTLRIFYGGADTVGASASLSLTGLLDSMDDLARLSFVKRAKQNPILEPVAEHDWESKAVFNSAAVDIDGATHLLYRAMGRDDISRLGYARLDDGVTVSERHPTPAYEPREPYESRGCEDPRLVKVGTTLYLTYVAYNGGDNVRGAVSSISVADFLAKRFNKWAAPKLVTPEGVVDKDVCLFPEPIDGKYHLMHRIDPNICSDVFDDLTFRRTVNRCIELMGPRPGMWDHEKVGAAAPPMKVELPDGNAAWLFIFHSISSDKVYRLGAALITADGTSLISRSALPIFEPIETWEKDGQIGNVVFSAGMTLRGDDLHIYYGGADTALGVAVVSLKDLIRRLIPVA